MRRRALVLAWVAAVAAAVLGGGPAWAEDWVSKPGAELILLDKVRGQPRPVSVKVGESAVFGSITIKVTRCLVRPPDQAEEATAFVDVTDSRESGSVFHGWIFLNTPSVSQMEHPVYDMRLAGCR